MAYRFLKIIGAALIISVLLLLSVFLYLRFSTSMAKDDEIGNPLLITASILSIGALFIANFVISKKYKAIRTDDLTEKLNEYKGIFIIIMALYEGPAMFFLITFYLSGSFIALAGAVFFIVLMLLIFPSLARLSTSLNLSEREIRMLTK